MFKKLLVSIMVAVSVLFFLNIKKGGDTGVFYGDALGYYLYLPSTFIYHNLDSMNSLPGDKGINEYIFTCVDFWTKEWTAPNGRFLDQYTFGVAVMEAPFFFAGHLIAKLTWQPATGFSECYQNAIRVSSIVYGLLGLIFIYKILRRYFTEKVSIISIFILFMGSNLFWFMLYQAGMSHIPLFFLFSLLMWVTIKLYEKPYWGAFAATGFLCGMIIYIRPADIVCVLIPLLYGLTSTEQIKYRFAFFKEHFLKIILAALICFIIWIPQMLYWKHITGSWLYDSYGKSQAFNFLHPQIWKGLFGASNGWLFYSPALLLCLPGLLLWKRFKPFSSVVFVALPVYVYVIYSWFCYNYINGLGSRPMVDIYALVALPLAASVSYVASKKIWVKALFSIFAVFTIALSFSFMLQEYLGVLSSEDSRFAYVRQILFKLHLNYDDLVVNDIAEKQPNPENLTPLGAPVKMEFSDTAEHVTKDSVGDLIYHVPADVEFPPLLVKIIYHKSTMKNIRWIKVSGDFYTQDWAGVWSCQAFVYTVERAGDTKKWNGVRINNKIGRAGKDLGNTPLYFWNVNEWGNVYFYSKIPDNIEDGDEIKVAITNSGKNTMLVKNVFVRMYGEK